MAGDTTNYNLVKPTADEFYNIEIFNRNADIIDTELKKVNEKVDEDKKKWNQAEENAKNYIDGKPWQRHPLCNERGTTIRLSDKNLNNLTKTGFYSGDSLINAPAGVTSWSIVEVFADDANDVIQRLYDLRGDKMYTRRKKDSNNWTPWVAIATEKDIEAVKQSGVDLRSKFAGVVNAKGVPASANDDFTTLIHKVGQITTGKRYAEGYYTAQGNISSNYIFYKRGLAFSPSIVLLSWNTYVGAERRDHFGFLWKDAKDSENKLFGAAVWHTGHDLREFQVKGRFTSDGFDFELGDFRGMYEHYFIAFE